MTTPNSDLEPGGARRAGETPSADARSADPGRDPDTARAPASSDGFPDGYSQAESALGGADSVQKTSYVTGEGTEPAGAPRASVVARAGTGGGINVGAWFVGLVALAIALVYAFGIFR